MIWIKRFFLISISIAILLGFSSCSTKGSNLFQEVSFEKPRNIQIEYKNEVYYATINFDGYNMTMVVDETDKNFGELAFIINEEECTTDYKTLKTTYSTAKLPDEYLPKIIYEFLSQTGQTFKTEKYNDETNQYGITKVVNSFCVELCVEGDNSVCKLMIKNPSDF